MSNTIKVRDSARGGAGRSSFSHLLFLFSAMKNDLFTDPEQAAIKSLMRWHTFAEIVLRLHKQGIYIHPHQLVEFFLWHGLPVDLCHVPPRLRKKAETVNEHYEGDMARLEETQDPFWHPLVVP